MRPPCTPAWPRPTSGRATTIAPCCTIAPRPTRTLAPEAYERARAAAEEALYAHLLTAARRDPESGRFERYIPFFLQGSLDDGGVYVYPGVKMRRYQTSDPKLYE